MLLWTDLHMREESVKRGAVDLLVRPIQDVMHRRRWRAKSRVAWAEPMYLVICPLLPTKILWRVVCAGAWAGGWVIAPTKIMEPGRRAGL